MRERETYGSGLVNRGPSYSHPGITLELAIGTNTWGTAAWQPDPFQERRGEEPASADFMKRSAFTIIEV